MSTVYFGQNLDEIADIICNAMYYSISESEMIEFIIQLNDSAGDLSFTRTLYNTLGERLEEMKGITDEK